MATTGYIWHSPEALTPHAEPARGPTLEMLSKQAREHRAWIVCGFAENGGGLLYNSALMVDPFGDLVRCYRKVLLYDADFAWARPGRQRMSIGSDLGRIAPAICMDLNDDDLIRYLHRAGVDVLAFCTNWVDEGSEVHPYWTWRLTGWPGWLVAANSWGEDEGTTFSGCSAIISPDKRVIASAGYLGDEVVLVDTEAAVERTVLPGDAPLW
ncbi:MAG: putative amidohydrolase [Myxococcota bacterium]|jgi:predicted amidohydrolase